MTNKRISRIATTSTINNSKTAPIPAPIAATGNVSLVEAVGKMLAVELIVNLLLVLETTDEDRCVLVDIIDDAVDCRLFVPEDDELAIAKNQ